MTPETTCRRSGFFTYLAAGLVCIFLPAFTDATSLNAQGKGTSDAQKKSETPKKGSPDDKLAPLPPDSLPPRTREKPDPAKLQYELDPLYVRIVEELQPKSGDAYTPEVPVLQNYLQEYFRRAGHRIVDRPEEASFRLEGSLYGAYDRVLKVRGRIVAYKVRGKCDLRVTDRAGRELETFAIPEVYQESSKSEKSAFLELRRYVAKVEWARLFRDSKTFSNQKVQKLLSALTVLPVDEEDEMSAEEIINRLAAIGFPAVPYLIEALSDTGTVRASSAYPGLAKRNLDDLRVYHIADKALEEIFQKVSRMGLDTTQRQRFRIVRGWELEWQRFCKPYRESPNEIRRRAKAKAARAKSQAAEAKKTADS